MMFTENLEINLIKDFNIMNLLYPEWLQLYNKSLTATPFQSPDWLIPWWKYFGNDQQLNMLEIRNNKQLCCLAPFFIYNHKDKNEKEIKFIGTGNSDYLDILVDEEIVSPCMNLIFEYLIKNRTIWDFCYLQGLQYNSPFLIVTPPDEIRKEIVRTEYCPVIYILENDGQNDRVKAIEKLLSKKFLKYLKRTQRILSEAGLLELEIADERNIDRYLNELFTLHKDRWELKNKPGVLGEGNLKAFHYEAVHSLISNNSLKLYRLIHNNITVAMLYALIKDKIMYNYIGAFNPSYKNFSPGSILLFVILEDCINQGIKEFNMLTGGEDYKYRWGAKDKVNYTIMIKHK